MHYLVSLLLFVIAFQVEAEIKVITSVNPIALLVKQVGAEKVQVSALLSAGRDAHTSELTVSEMVKISSAGIVFLNGLGLEPWSQGLSTSIKEKTVQLADICVLDKGDVHTWLDPQIALCFVDLITKRLCKQDESNCEYYKTNSVNLLEEIKLLDGELQGLFRSVPNKSFVVYHGSWTRFAKRYGLEQVTFTGDMEVTQPNVRDYVDLINRAKLDQIELLVAEIGNPKDAVETLKNEGKFRLIWLDPLGQDDIKYVNFLRRNAEALASALKNNN
jgi:ABC-type Zn uptake system ZnuABC Zn-binding protein ZnuA